MTVHEIVKEWLTAHGYDGLYHEEGCGCELSDFEPCGQMSPNCEAGRIMRCKECPDNPPPMMTWPWYEDGYGWEEGGCKYHADGADHCVRREADHASR